MSWTVKTRGASSQPMLQDFLCDDCGPISTIAPRDVDSTPCPDCGKPARWVISAPRVAIPIAEVVRGGVAKPDSPMYLDTRPLAEGMPLTEWKARRQKLYEERRWKESKKL